MELIEFIIVISILIHTFFIGVLYGYLKGKKIEINVLYKPEQEEI